jgi:hypothetical protein
MANGSGISNNDFTIILDDNNLNEWQMAGKGKFVVLRREKEKEMKKKKKRDKVLFYNQKEEWDYCGMPRKCMGILYLN